jgi:hypothetical protein
MSSLLWRKGALLLAPLAALLVVEGVLGLLQVAPVATFFCAQEEQERRRYWPNSASPWGPLEVLFAGVEFETPKPERTLRIFCVGASTVRGFPFDPLMSFPLFLEALLRQKLPGWDLEVFVCAANGRNADSLVPLVAELAGYEPDALVVYCGHNELHTWNRPLLERPWSRRARSFLDGWRLGRLLLGKIGAHPGGRREGGTPDLAAAAGSGETETSTEPPSLRVLQQALQLYRESLSKMQAATAEYEVPLLLCRPVSNLRDYPPSPAPLPDSARQALQQARGILENARPLPGRGLPVEEIDLAELPSAEVARAVSCLQQSLAQTPGLPQLSYLLGRCQLGLQDHGAARESLQRALECDAYPIRCLPAFQNVVLEATSQGAFLVDPQPAFVQSADHGLPGEDLFVDNVHPRFEGQRLLAQSVLKVLQMEVRLVSASAWSSEEVSEDQLEAALHLPEKSRSLARRLATLGLRSLQGGAARGTEIRWAWRRAFSVALSLDPHSSEALLGRALVDLVYGSGQDSAGRIRTIVTKRTDLLAILAKVGQAHEDWLQLLQPVLKQP